MTALGTSRTTDYGHKLCVLVHTTYRSNHQTATLDSVCFEAPVLVVWIAADAIAPQ